MPLAHVDPAGHSFGVAVPTGQLVPATVHAAQVAAVVPDPAERPDVAPK